MSNIYQDINQYILLEQKQRQSHLDLNDGSIEIGGTSQEFRGTLAHYLMTTIPKGMKIYLCHACHNAKCSNPKHLYWGTAKENFNDAIKNGRMNIHEACIKKYGCEYQKIFNPKRL